MQRGQVPLSASKETGEVWTGHGGKDEQICSNVGTHETRKAKLNIIRMRLVYQNKTLRPRLRYVNWTQGNQTDRNMSRESKHTTRGGDDKIQTRN